MNESTLRGLLLAAVLSLAGCSLATGRLVTSEATPACAAFAGDRVGSLTATPVGAPLEALRFPGSAQEVTDSFGHVVRGACATSVHTFVAGEAILDSGERFQIDHTGAIVRPREVLPPPPSGPTSGPNVPGAKFISARKVNSMAGAAFRSTPGVDPGEYLGLWRRRDGWFIGGYRVRADGRTSAVKPLLTSRLPLLGLDYLPSPDTNTGQVGLVQQLDGRTVKLLAFGWDHSRWFPS